MFLIDLPRFHGKTNVLLQLCRYKMVKVHNCLLKIYNGQNSGHMTYVTDWYDSGRLGDGFSWPMTIKPGHESQILNYERDWALAGCSGYVTYRMFDTDITIAFSNPSVGNNKLGVGISGKGVWDHLSDHGYDKFTINIDTSNGKATLQFDCKCTGGTTNICTVNITAYKK